MYANLSARVKKGTKIEFLQNGHLRFINKNGNTQEGLVVNGKREGIWIFSKFNNNLQRIEHCTFLHGRKNGIQVTIKFEEGVVQRIYSLYFVNGRIRSMKN